MTSETLTGVKKFAAPYGREVELVEVLHESGMRTLRVRIREGKRFTIMDLDAATAAEWGEAMIAWAAKTET
jgi:hypothetical protein